MKRREFNVGLAATAIAGSVGAMERMKVKMPTAFIPHGGGPWPVIDMGIGRPGERDALAGYMRSIAAVPPSRPRALLVISAHWEERVLTVNTSASPGMLYDYGGFGPEAYKLKWAAPGDPQLADQVADLLKVGGFEVARTADRGYDHGTFIPLLLAYPKADIPTVQLSLRHGLDPAEHLAIGRALSGLREQGVYILGSGNSFHNMREFMRPGDKAVGASHAFDGWLDKAVRLPEAQRHAALQQWSKAPDGLFCHPRAEHLIPLMVAAGAAGADAGTTAWTGAMAGLKISAHHFGV